MHRFVVQVNSNKSDLSGVPRYVNQQPIIEGIQKLIEELGLVCSIEVEYVQHSELFIAGDK